MQTRDLSPLTTALLQICPDAGLQIDDQYLQETIYAHSALGPAAENGIALHRQLGDGLLLTITLPRPAQNGTVASVLDSILASHSRASRRQTVSRPAVSQNRLLMDYLLRRDAEENMTNIIFLAQEVGIDLSLYRFVCLLDYSSLTRQPAFLSDHFFSIVQRHFAAEFPCSRQILAQEYNSRQYLFCVPDPQREVSPRAFLPPLLNGLNQRIKSAFGHSCYIGVGFCVKQPGDYLEALLAAQVALRFSTADPEGGVSYIEDDLLDYDIENMMTMQMREYLVPYLQRLREEPQLYEIMQALLDSDLDYAQAADRLYMHKNTFLKRMRGLKETLDLDPLRSDSDCILLAILLQYIKSGRTW